MKMFLPEEHAEALVRKGFYYAADSDAPYKREVTSLVERKARLSTKSERRPVYYPFCVNPPGITKRSRIILLNLGV